MGFSIWQLLIVLVIVVLLFGTKKLRNMGGDLGGALKNFKDAVKDGEEENKNNDSAESVEHKDADFDKAEATKDENKSAVERQ